MKSAGHTILMLVLMLSCCPAQERGIKSSPDDSQPGAGHFYSGSRALLIGINKYRNVNNLNYAVADAESIRNLLIRKFDFKPENAILLTDRQATKKNITDAFAQLLESSADERVLVFYAGHGTQISLSGGGEMGYLVPVDGKSTTPSELYSSCISMEDLKTLSSQIPAKHVLFLVDACYGGLSAVTNRALTNEAQFYLQKITAAPARQIITAGGRDEPDTELPEWGHSAFTRSLLDGLDKGLADLNGDGLITASELATYLKTKVSYLSEEKQTPQFAAFAADEGDFVFTLPTKVEPIPAPTQATVKTPIQEPEPPSTLAQRTTWFVCAGHLFPVGNNVEDGEQFVAKAKLNDIWEDITLHVSFSSGYYHWASGDKDDSRVLLQGGLGLEYQFWESRYKKFRPFIAIDAWDVLLTTSALHDYNSEFDPAMSIGAGFRIEPVTGMGIGMLATYQGNAYRHVNPGADFSHRLLVAVGIIF